MKDKISKHKGKPVGTPDMKKEMIKKKVKGKAGK
jgi:hypothetical protein